MSKEQREYLLRQQMRAIQQELGEKTPSRPKSNCSVSGSRKPNCPTEVRREPSANFAPRTAAAPAPRAPGHPRLPRLRRSNCRGQADRGQPRHRARARQVLDEDHYDLKEVKERILEHLGVLKLKPEAKAPILCFVGPPGVGKTSLGQSIARALGRKFERMSLGGLHDEAELRGHRRTYIGAMPGRLIQAMRRAGAKNPGADARRSRQARPRLPRRSGRGAARDPRSGAEQDVPRQLSRPAVRPVEGVLHHDGEHARHRFRGRCSTAWRSCGCRGYSEEEKVQIARRYLIPRQLKEAGLTARAVHLDGRSAARRSSAATRARRACGDLERAIGRVTRKIALRFAEGNTESGRRSRPEDLAEMLGPEPFTPESCGKRLPAGVATGSGLDRSRRRRPLHRSDAAARRQGADPTGQLGEVMQESAKAAQSYVWSHADDFGIDPTSVQGATAFTSTSRPARFRRTARRPA